MDDATARAPGVRRAGRQRDSGSGVEMDEADSAGLAASSAGAAVGHAGDLRREPPPAGHLFLQGAVMLVASMAASAVLIFATPRGQLSQPWPVVVGQVTAAVVGVTCVARMIGHREVAARRWLWGSRSWRCGC